MNNREQIQTIFKDSVIVRIYEDKKQHYFDICEYANYGSRKRTLTINLNQYFIQKNKKSFDILGAEINNLELKIDTNNLDILKAIQSFCIRELNIYYDVPINNLPKYIILPEFKKVDKTKSLLDNKLVDSIDFTLISYLTHVFILNKITKSISNVSFNVRNIQLHN